jgi:hypothetical protein
MFPERVQVRTRQLHGEPGRAQGGQEVVRQASNLGEDLDGFVQEFTLGHDTSD